VRRVILVVALEAVTATLVAVFAGVLAVALARPASTLEESQALLLGAVAGAGVVGLGVAALVAVRHADRLGETLETLRQRVERLAGGDTRPSPLTTGVAEVDRLDEALVRGAQHTARRLASERDFAADASHQLRTPLTALLMRLEEIAATDDLGVVAEESTIAIAQVERLSRVVDDLMSRTRSGVGASPAVSLDSVLASLQREWQPAFASARRSILVSGERGLGVRATPVALAQILTTLLENSLSHGRGTVEIAARRSGPSVVIEVTDGGEGVPAAIAPHIFERSVSSTGSGLGLSLARDLAEAAGGRLELVSARPAVFALFLSAVTEG
jgi:signal transduction histidine kinase